MAVTAVEDPADRWRILGSENLRQRVLNLCPAAWATLRDGLNL